MNLTVLNVVKNQISQKSFSLSLFWYSNTIMHYTVIIFKLLLQIMIPIAYFGTEQTRSTLSS